MRSSRKIVRALERDVSFRVVAANPQPDFRTICRFRAEHGAALESFIGRICAGAVLPGKDAGRLDW